VRTKRGLDLQEQLDLCDGHVDLRCEDLACRPVTPGAVGVFLAFIIISI
jgi:hypothetical protein